MSKSHSIGYETLIILGILFGFYVVGDVTSTVWLIAKHPEGLAGESNPLGILLYSQQGFFGLVTAKLLVFLAISVMTLIIEYHYKNEKIVMLVTNFSILGLMALSLIVVTVNVMTIYLLSLQEGSYESTFILRTYTVLFVVTLAGLFLLPKFIPNTLSIAEIILALVVILGPLAFSPGLYQYLLADNLINFLVYLGINVGIIGLMIFGMNRLYKQIIPKKQFV